jgi:uncharacterized protein YbjT (DUF2867 family)
MSQINRVLVIGATGVAGEPVARKLAKLGYTVRLLTKNVERARERFSPPFEVTLGDVRDPDSIACAIEDCDGVHLSVSPSSNDDHPEDFEPVAARNVAAAARVAGVQRITYVSGSTAFRKNDRFAPTRAKLDAEEAIRESGVPWTVFCPSWFMESLTRFINNKKAHVFGKFRHPWNWVAAEDFGRMVATSYGLDEVLGKRLHIHGPQGFTLPQTLDMYRMVVEPELEISQVALWKLRMLALISGKPGLKKILPFMRYMGRTPEGGDPDEANRLLGKPQMTLEQWCQRELENKVRAVDAATTPSGATTAGGVDGEVEE